MIIDIIQAICNKINFCLTFENGDSYFVSDGSVDSDSLKFIDPVTKKGENFSKDTLDTASLITFGANTIPTLPIINAIKEGDNSFFIENKLDHEASNQDFNKKLSKIKSYTETFGDESGDLIKKYVLNNNTADLDKLQILGATKIVCFTDSTGGERAYIRTLFRKLIDKKLAEAIAEIDKSMEGIDDKDFIEDAEIIKKDLVENVQDYWVYMKGVTFDKLFNQWPTLLNPSPFDQNGN